MNAFIVWKVLLFKVDSTQGYIRYYDFKKDTSNLIKIEDSSTTNSNTYMIFNLYYEILCIYFKMVY